ncbi:protein FAR1-RELATED SEQUENCE 5 [Prunus persica]|uniref:protein FAR1-RELATED SEQUENCE 5 n=1 Tax=Prunus persica TaxID=3760 RepID=UPI0009AB27DF|nr:protein FAR1-RELATED SEQUENCE 5 [Prunus persica]
MQAHTASVLMDHEEDEFHATYSNDGKEYVDCIHLDSDSESLDLLDHNEQIEELTRKFGDSPTLGMSFDNEQEAYQYYNSYARGVGFSVRKLRVNKDKNGVIHKREFCCSCEGFYRKKTTPKKKREQRRFGCKAMLGIKLNRDGKYVVKNFIAEHNHDLVPLSSSHLLRSQRTIEPSQAGFINQMHHAGLKPSQIFSYMTTEAGGPQHLNFIQADCNNLIMRKRIEFQKRGDSQCLLEYFKQKQAQDKSFFYSVRTNMENEICGCFFCDGKPRRDYAIFGDVLCFDTTFKTNNYNMVCAPIIGLNNHGQTILFGCGLLDGESTDACEWLFKVFLQANEGKEPKTIFTDQAQSIAAAIIEVFPNCHHRLCLWHIYQNAAKNLGHVFSEFQAFAKDFKSCVYDPEIVEEFESSWEALLDDYGLRGNSWLEGIYALREKWAQVYGRDHFCAGMTTTQRSESINAFLKKFFSRNLLLREFVVQYDKAVADRREKERQAETSTKQKWRNLSSNWNVEIEATTKYTSKLFYCFQDECKKLLGLRLKLQSDDGLTRRYMVMNSGMRGMSRSLTYDLSDQTVSCSCKKFEFEGILCAHALKLYHELEFSTLPSKYYLKRWSKEATCDVDFDSNEEVPLSTLESSSMVQYSELSHIVQRIIAKGARNNQTCTFLKSELLQLEAKLEKHPYFGDEHDEILDKHVSEDGDNLKLRDPKIQKSKGRGKGRIKSSLESKPSKRKGSSKRKDFQYGFPTVSSVQGIPNHPLGYQAIHPLLSNYSLIHPQENIQLRPEGPAYQLSFSHPSTS